MLGLLCFLSNEMVEHYSKFIKSQVHSEREWGLLGQ